MVGSFKRLKSRNKFNESIENLENVGVRWTHPENMVMVVKRGISGMLGSKPSSSCPFRNIALKANRRILTWR